MFYPIHTANMQAIKAIGKSETFLVLEIIKKLLELISLLLVMKISVMAIAINMAVLTTLFTFINAYPNIKYLDYSFKEQMNDMLPSLLLSTIMAIFVYGIGLILPISDLGVLIVQVLFGVAFYSILSYLTNNPEFKYLYELIVSNVCHE